MMTTLNYYNEHAEAFAADTRYADMHAAQERFLAYLEPGGYILDFGCGSGRDSKTFLELGYRVAATDGSEELCALASTYTGIEVKHQLFQELAEVDTYDGIWACSSILHLTRNDLPSVLGKMLIALKENAIAYASFKYGDFEGERNGRYFTNLTEESLHALLEEVPGFIIEECWLTGDVRPGRDSERWLNVILRKRAHLQDKKDASKD